MGFSLARSGSTLREREKLQFLQPVSVNHCRYGHSDAVGVIITLEDYNDTPPRTRSPVSTVIKQTAAFCG